MPLPERRHPPASRVYRANFSVFRSMRRTGANSELCHGAVLADRVVVGKTGRFPGGQGRGWKNRTLFWRTGSWLEKQDAGLADRVVGGKTGRCMGGQGRIWKNKTPV